DMLEPYPIANTIVEFMPLKYLAYFPAAIFLGKIAGWDLVWGLLGQFGWLVFFIVLSRTMLYLGIKRYSGFGG
ncbi:MAG: ABC-2 family transporter protein, partial [bacterium]|nr:ABC-2 family transporter protein [bacterium]